MRRLALAAATVLLAAPQIAAAAEAPLPCLTPKEATAVAAYAMPSAITGTVQRCTPALGKQSWLALNGDALSKRYGERKVAVWPDAKGALLKMASTSKDAMAETIKSLPDQTIQQLADSMIVAAVADKVQVGRCQVIDRFLSLIAPLPAENTAELVALTLGLVSQGESPKLGKFALCKA